MKGFVGFMKLERSLSSRTVEVYSHSVWKLRNYLDMENLIMPPEKVEVEHLRGFLVWINQEGIAARTQVKIMHGIRSFYHYLWTEGVVKQNVSLMIDLPVLGFRLPVMLSVTEIDRMIRNIDLNTPEGLRNKAMVETLYGCGLRVSELVNLKISELFFREVKPGITSWGIVKYGYASNPGEMIKRLDYDLEYLENRSFMFDLKIIFHTIGIIIKGLGV